MKRTTTLQVHSMFTKRFVTMLCCMVFYCFAMAESYDLRIADDGTKWRPFVEYGQFGVKDNNGKIIVPAKYTYVNYENGTYTVKNNCKCIGKYDRNGKIIFPPYKYTIVYELAGMKDSPFIVIGDHYAVLNRKGKVILEEVYCNIQVYGDDKTGYNFMLWKDGYMGVADMNGKILIEPNKYNTIGRQVVDGIVYFPYNIYGGGSGVCNSKGKELISTDYNITMPKGSGANLYFEVTKGNVMGKIDREGNVITPLPAPKESLLKSVNIDGEMFYIYNSSNDKCYVKDKNGKLIIPASYDWINAYKSYFTVWDKNHMGLINKRGKEIVPTKAGFTSIAALEKHVIATDLNDCQAIYSYDGEMLFPPIHKKVAMSEHKFKSKKDYTVSYKDADGAWGIKDLQGNILVQPIYDDFNYMETDNGLYFYVFKNGKVGLQYEDGTLVFTPEYKGFSYLKTDFGQYFYVNTGYMGLADIDGNIIINPETFERISYDQKKNQFTCTYGKVKCVFNHEGKLLSSNKKDVEKDEFIDLADSYFEKENYKKAAEHYGKAIAISPDASLYFNRGVSYYNMDKYYEAIADFRRALNSKPSERIRDRSLDLIEKSEYYQEQKEIRNVRIAQAVFGLAMTGINYAIMSSQSKNNGTYSSNRNSVYTDVYSNSGSSVSDDSTDATSTSTSPAKKKGKCGFCGGKGSTVEYVANYGIDKEPWCDECGKRVVSGHYHKTCQHCNGTGER